MTKTPAAPKAPKTPLVPRAKLDAAVHDLNEALRAEKHLIPVRVTIHRDYRSTHVRHKMRAYPGARAVLVKHLGEAAVESYTSSLSPYPYLIVRTPLTETAAETEA